METSLLPGLAKGAGHAYELAWAGIAAGRRETFHARKDAFGTFQSVDVIYIASVAPDTNATTATRIDSAPVPPELNVGVLPCAEGLCQIA